jgi:hypothetical protein
VEIVNEGGTQALTFLSRRALEVFSQASGKIIL